MAPVRKSLLLSLLLVVLCSTAKAQDEDSGPIKIDTTINIVEEEAVTPEAKRFEAVTSEDQQPVAPRPVNQQKVGQMRKDKDFWYVNTVPPREKEEPKKTPEKSSDPVWLRNVLWLLVVGGFVTLIIWFLLSSDVKLFRKTPPVVTKQEEEEEYSTENLFDIDYDSALNRATAAHNYRLAIRLLYLQTLKELALHNIIQYRQERTNSDYLMQLFQTSYYKDFFRLTRNFEYAWYGQFSVSPPAFEQIRNEFSAFNQRMPS